MSTEPVQFAEQSTETLVRSRYNWLNRLAIGLRQHLRKRRREHSEVAQILSVAVIGLSYGFDNSFRVVAHCHRTKGNVPMLWTSLRWNWGNTLVIAAFCLLAMLSAVNNAFVSSDSDAIEARATPACIGLCGNYAQLPIGATRADVAPAMTVLLQPQPFAVD